jgi:hypothetical protein
VAAHTPGSVDDHTARARDKYPRCRHNRQVMDPAARLGVSPGAGPATVRAAFARELRSVHPDVAAPGAANPASDIAELLAARDQLLGPRARSSRPHTSPVVFYPRPRLIHTIRAWFLRGGQPRRNLS